MRQYNTIWVKLQIYTPVTHLDVRRLGILTSDISLKAQAL